MGTLTYFPTERYGAVTRATEQPHAVERLVAWLRKAAPIRAKASMGCEETLELAPNMTTPRPRADMARPRISRGMLSATSAARGVSIMVPSM